MSGIKLRPAKSLRTPSPSLRSGMIFRRQCFNKTPAGGSYIPEVTRLVMRTADDSIIDLTVVIPTVEMIESAARECAT